MKQKGVINIINENWTNNRDQILILHSDNRIFLQFILNWFSVLCARKESDPVRQGSAKIIYPKYYKKYALTREMSCMCISLFDRKKDTLNKTNYKYLTFKMNTFLVQTLKCIDTLLYLFCPWKYQKNFQNRIH